MIPKKLFVGLGALAAVLALFGFALVSQSQHEHQGDYSEAEQHGGHDDAEHRGGHGDGGHRDRRDEATHDGSHSEAEHHTGMHHASPLDVAASDEAASGEVWYCPMHTHVTSDHKGSCPVCGMHLVRKTSEPASSDEIHVEPAVQKRMGIVVEPAQRHAFQASIRVPAQVVPDQRRTVSLSPKMEGWVERIRVSVVGQPVRAGQVMYEIYSPELQQRQKDYLDLLTRRDALLAARSGDMSSVGNSPPDLMLASVARERYRVRSRLLAADVPASVLEELERFRRVREVVPVLAEQDGVVTAINARVGSFVSPGEAVVAYSDPRSVWAELSISPRLLHHLAEYDHVKLRATAETRRLSIPIDASLVFIDPVSKSAKLPVPLPAAGHTFLPGMLLDAEMQTTARAAITLPLDAVLRTGHGDFVVRAEASNHFRPVQVRLGNESHDRVEILEGLEPGDPVVVNGQFMLSAESALQSSLRRMAAAH